MHVHVISDTALNDSNKTISIPNGPWEVASIRVEYTATATAGNRTLEVRVLDGDSDIISGTRLTTNITASDVMVINFSPGAPTVAPTDNAVIGSLHIPPFIPPGASIQVIDTAAVAAAADDMIVHIIVGSSG